MTEERVTERTDGINSERVVERDATAPTTTVIERKGSGAGLLIGLAILLAVLVGGYYLLAQNRNDAVKTEAVSKAADKVGDAASKVGDSAEKAVDDVTK